MRRHVCFPVTRRPKDLLAVRAGERSDAWGTKELFLEGHNPNPGDSGAP